MIWRVSIRCTSEEAVAIRDCRAGLAPIDRHAFVSIHPAVGDGHGWIADIFTREQPSAEMFEIIGVNLPLSGMGIPNVMCFGKQVPSRAPEGSRAPRYGRLLRAAFG